MNLIDYDDFACKTEQPYKTVTHSHHRKECLINSTDRKRCEQSSFFCGEPAVSRSKLPTTHIKVLKKILSISVKKSGEIRVRGSGA